MVVTGGAECVWVRLVIMGVLYYCSTIMEK